MFKLSKMDEYGNRWSPNRTVEVRPAYHTNTLGGHTPRISFWIITNKAKDEQHTRPTLEMARECAEWMAKRNGELPVLTKAQAKALKMIREDGEFYSGMGVSKITIARLEELGLVTVKWKTVQIDNYTTSWGRASNRPKYQLEWVAKPKEIAA